MYCPECYDHMRKNQEPMLANRSRDEKELVRCALCRELCEHSQSYLVSTRRQKPESPKLTSKSNFNDNYTYQQDLDLSKIKMKASQKKIFSFNSIFAY